MTDMDPAPQPIPAQSPTTTRRIRIGLILFAAIFVATMTAWGYALWTEMPLPGFELSAEEVAATMRSWGMWGAAAIIALMILHSFVPFPAEFVALAAGMIFGPLWGTVYVWIGAMLGALLAFGLSRWFGRPFVETVLPERYWRRLDTWTARQGASTLLVSRFIPVIAFNLINYAAGLTNMTWWTFIWATGIGILPLTALMVVMGDQMTGLPWWSWVALALVAVALWFVLRYYQNRLKAGNNVPKSLTAGRPQL